jgi:hypothetical protein
MQMLHDQPVAAGPVVLDKHIQAMYGIGVIRLQSEDAAALWLLTGMSWEQWTGLASALNVQLDKAAKYRYGGILPSVTTMQKRLRDNGDLLESSCYELFDVKTAGTVYVVDDDGAFVEEEPDCAVQDRAFGTGNKWKGVLVVDLENVLLVPEMRLVQQLCPQAWRKMCETGTVHICIQADNCSVENFGRFAQKLEQGVLRVLMPLKNQPQQRPAHNIHFLLYEGGESYESLEKVFHKMLLQGRFPKKLALPPLADQPGVELVIVWHVCSNHLLMSLLTGMGGAGSQGLDLEAIVQEVLKICRPLQKCHGGQLEKIYGQQHLIWEHPKITEAVGKMSGDSVQSRVVTSVKSVWKCLSAVHREVHQAQPDVDVVKGYAARTPQNLAGAGGNFMIMPLRVVWSRILRTSRGTIWNLFTFAPDPWSIIIDL